MSDRAASIHAARVYLAQSRHFTGRARGFSFVLLGWASNARRRSDEGGRVMNPAKATQTLIAQIRDKTGNPFFFGDPFASL